MVLGAVTGTIQAIIQVITQHKLLAIALTLFILAVSGTTINSFFIGNSYTCETNNATGEVVLYDTEVYSECLPIYIQAKFYKMNLSKNDCDSSTFASNPTWKETCYDFVKEIDKTSFLLDTLTPFQLFFNDISDNIRGIFGGNETKTIDNIYSSAFESNICTKLYNCMPEEKAEAIGLFKGCRITKGNVADDLPTLEEFESVSRVTLSITDDEQTFEKKNIFQVQCFGFGDEKRPTLSLLGFIPIFDWQFMFLITILGYWSLFMFWLADKVGL